MQEKLNQKHFFFLLFIIILANAFTLFNEILEPDGTLYASIAKEIAISNNWFFLKAYGTDWLDKPHLPFWLAALSFKIFGFSAWAYKLPSLLLFFISLWYTYKLAFKIYGEAIAQISVLILGSSLHIIVSNFDGKAEIYLMAFVVAAIYYFYKAQFTKRGLPIVLAALCSACAIMTKGIFALLTIGIGFILYWIITKQWKQFIQIRWYIFIILCVVFILPELVALYFQFDVNPQKIVFNKTNVSGIKFFFWDSQFGRFFNNGPIKGKGDLSFFLHTTIWAFLPWSIIFFCSVFYYFKQYKKNANASSIILKGTAAFSFVLFSLSKFQLPHYIILLFPYFSILTSNYLFQISNSTLEKFNKFQVVLMGIFLLAIFAVTYFFQLNNVAIFLCLIGVCLIGLYYAKSNTIFHTILYKNVCIALVLSLFLNLFFYPQLLTYQGGMMAAKWLNKNKISACKEVILYKNATNGFNFYYSGNTNFANSTLPIKIYSSKKDSILVYGKYSDIEQLKNDSTRITYINKFPSFWVSQLTGAFINNATRKNTLDTFALAFLKSNKK
jgi:4-amino-4-deoxy-L-arabinose transferase-like glycosyltransferase